MPKGTKSKDAPPPPIAGCDFCGQDFKPAKWNQRTCIACKVLGGPDQSGMDWTDYQKAAANYSRQTGRRKPLTGAALWKGALPSAFLTRGGRKPPRRKADTRNAPAV